jgi:hypothetical protein
MPKVPLPPTLDPKIEALKAKRLAAQADLPKPTSRITHRLDIVALSNGDIRIIKDRAQHRIVPEKIKARLAREQDLVAAIRDQIRPGDSGVIAEARLYMAMYDLTRCSWAALARLITGEESGADYVRCWDRIINCLALARAEGVAVYLRPNSEESAKRYEPLSSEQ